MTDMNNPTNQSSTSGKAANADQVLDTLNQVFAAFQDKIKNQGPKPFEGEAENAVNVFNDIIVGLALKSKPVKPENLTAKPVSTEQIDLIWTVAGGNNVEGYKLERSKISKGAFDEIAQLAPSAGGFSDKGFDKSTIYYYKLKVYNVKGESEYASASAKTK